MVILRCFSLNFIAIIVNGVSSPQSKLSYDDFYSNILAYCQEYLIYHDYWSNHLVPHLEQRPQVGHMNSHNQMNSCHHCYYVLHFWHSEGGRTVLFVSELVLMHLEQCKEDLFALLLRCWQLDCPMEVAVVKVAEQLCSSLHEFMYQHECRLLCNAKPTNQLVAYIGQPGDCLWQSRVHFLKLSFARSLLSGHCIPTTLFHLVRLTSWKH